jgi:hypothetical protein
MACQMTVYLYTYVENFTKFDHITKFRLKQPDAPHSCNRGHSRPPHVPTTETV